MRILAAEDDPVSRLILRKAVERAGHECQLAEDGAAAWDLFLESSPEVVISDWMMPRLDGLELCRRVRAHQSRGYTYFILLTALGDREHLLEGLQAGADDYLAKPLDRDDLGVRLLSAERVTSLHRKLAEQAAELERLNAVLLETARTDPLTGLGNRRRLEEDLAVLQERANRYGHNYCLALCDVDFFKRYNDRYGHPAGDEVLRQVARTLRSSLRASDSAYRYGGEEFLLILPEQTPDTSTIVLERVRTAVQQLAIPHLDSEAAAVVTISAGIAVFTPGATDHSGAWLQRADEALYRAKAGGRNRVEVADLRDPADAVGEAAD